MTEESDFSQSSAEGPPAEEPNAVDPGSDVMPGEPTPEARAAAVEGASAEAAAPGDPDLVDQLEPIRLALDGVGRRLDELVRLGDHHEQLIDRLHEENQRLRAGEVAQVQAPVVREMIRTYDLVVTLEAQSPHAAEDLALVRRRLIDALEQVGVRPISPVEGEPFSAATHVAEERADTSDSELDMTVARVVKLGFIQDGERVIRPVGVAVHTYRPRAAPDVASTTDASREENTSAKEA